MTDGRTFEVLDGDECYRLLAAGGLGRIGVNGDHFPLILPVDYALDPAGVIVLRTAAGTAVDDADHANVAFEVDHVDRTDGTGWSVLVHGLAERVTETHDAALVARTRRTAVIPTAPGERDRWLRLIPQAISGRRITGGGPRRRTVSSDDQTRQTRSDAGPRSSRVGTGGPTAARRAAPS